MAKDDGLKQYLKKNPWPSEYYHRTSVDYFFNFTIELSPEELWPVIADTSEINRFLGLGKMNFIEKDGKLFGTGNLSFFNLEWEEIPWEWEAGKEIKTERIYNKGVISYFRAHCVLTAIDNSSTMLTIYMGWIPRNFAGHILLKISENKIAGKYKKIFTNIEARKNSEDPAVVPVLSKKDHQNRKNYEDKLVPLRAYLEDKDIESSLIDGLFSYIIDSDDDKLFRIKPKVLAVYLNADLDRTISLLLHSCTFGLLNLSWDIVCPHCRGMRENHPHLWSVKNTSSCEICDIDFSSGGMNIIEVTFSVNPEIRKVEKIFYCSAEPAKKPHILLQKTLSRGGNYVFHLPDTEKRLRFRNKGKKSYGILDIDKKSSVKNLYWDDLNSSSIIKCAPGSTVFLNNTENRELQYIIEAAEEDQQALRPSELFNFHEFREIFSDETLAYGISIDIGIQNIVFVDIAGSTEYYKKFGDTEAFKTIRKYFIRVHDITKKYRGVIVKTIGDAVMLSFQSPVDALRCSIKLVSVFNGTYSEVPLSVRVSVNRGSCLAVNLDTFIDYFGQTVNIASKLQNFTGAGEISLTEVFTEEPTVKKYLKEKNYNFKNSIRAEIKGAGEITFRKIRIRKAP